jgi:hypothetical protein
VENGVAQHVAQQYGAERRRMGEGWIPWPPVLDVVAVQKRIAQGAGCAYYSQIDAMGDEEVVCMVATRRSTRECSGVPPTRPTAAQRMCRPADTAIAVFRPR